MTLLEHYRRAVRRCRNCGAYDPEYYPPVGDLHVPGTCSERCTDRILLRALELSSVLTRSC